MMQHKTSILNKYLRTTQCLLNHPQMKNYKWTTLRCNTREKPVGLSHLIYMICPNVALPQTMTEVNKILPTKNPVMLIAYVRWHPF